MRLIINRCKHGREAVPCCCASFVFAAATSTRTEESEPHIHMKDRANAPPGYRVNLVALVDWRFIKLHKRQPGERDIPVPDKARQALNLGGWEGNPFPPNGGETPHRGFSPRVWFSPRVMMHTVPVIS